MPRPGRSRWPRYLLEAALVAAVLWGVWAWQTRDLLPAGERIAAPALDLVDLQGRRWEAADLAGQRTVLYFFAPWCKVCAASAHQLRWFEQIAGDSARVVLVALDWSSVDELSAYAADHRLAQPLLLGDARTARDWHVRGYPTYYVLDADGRVAGADMGFSTAAGLWLRSLAAR